MNSESGQKNLSSQTWKAYKETSLRFFEFLLFSKHKISYFSVALKETFSWRSWRDLETWSEQFPEHPELMERYPGPAAWPGQGSVALEVPSVVLYLLGRCGIALGCPGRRFLSGQLWHRLSLG